MKRLIISVVILAVVLGVSYGGMAFVMSTYEKITRELTYGEELADRGEYELAREHCRAAEKIYEDTEQFLAVFVNHGILDDIGERIAAVAPLADKDSLPEFKSSCREAKISLRHMRNDHSFIIGNLF